MCGGGRGPLHKVRPQRRLNTAPWASTGGDSLDGSAYVAKHDHPLGLILTKDAISEGGEAGGAEERGRRRKVGQERGR